MTEETGKKGPADEAASPQPSTRAQLRKNAMSLSVRGFALTVTGRPSNGVAHVALGERASIGSHPSNDLVLEDDTVSRFHCEIRMTADGPRVTDLGSLNTTVVDGVTVVDAFLRDGSELHVGGSVVRFAFVAQATKVELSSATRFGTMIGRSPSMRATFALLERAAGSTATILLEGETGTGKGQAATSLHATGARKAGPFLTLDCSAIPPSLLESELFGHEKGAFTGAVGARAGVFEAADGGTLFLDEIGELPLDLQPKLLRALENREIRRVGATSARSVDVRVIAATNRDLRAEVNSGRFRSDLFFRLAVLRIALPPLRQRAEDVAPLVDVILESLGASAADAELVRTPAFLAQLQAASWPGNVRELRNCVERCLVFQEARLEDGPRSHQQPQILPAPAESARADASMPYAAARDRAVEHFERAYVVSLLASHDGNVTDAARAAGIGRVYLHKLMRRHGVR